MRPLVFLDTGIFIALMNRRDRWHTQAVALFGGPKPRWGTSFLIVSEGYSWFLHRINEEAAREFLRLVDALTGLRIFAAGREHDRQVRRLLDRFRGAKLTYVDASSLSLIDRHGVDVVWSTDHHLSLTGVEVIPR